MCLFAGMPTIPAPRRRLIFSVVLSAGNPAPFHQGSGRLELAHAITAKDNPLTARVIVNRVWLHHFGAGIVRSPSDFGVRGDPPSHPELLDYLAIRFMESGWSLKKLHRMILLSATYQQSSQDNPEARRQDPGKSIAMENEPPAAGHRGAARFAARGFRPTRSQCGRTAVFTDRDARRTAPHGLWLHRARTRSRFPEQLRFRQPRPARSHTLQHHRSAAGPVSFEQYIRRGTGKTPCRAKRNGTDGRRNRDAAEPAKRIQALYRSVFGRAATPHEVELGERFVASPSHEEPPATPASTWQYGFGEFDAAAGRIKSFTPFTYFDESWQAAPTLPIRIGGSARLRAAGGQPGEDPQHAVIRRWVSPVAGKIDIEGNLAHDQTDLPTGDGVRARIVSSRSGELASWIVNGSGAETTLTGITVEKGDTIDFIVDGRADTENDAFTWAPKIRLEGAEKEWSASADFRGPAAQPLSVWERYAQVLLETNEFAFVD